jgi:hypothetical protein
MTHRVRRLPNITWMYALTISDVVANSTLYAYVQAFARAYITIMNTTPIFKGNISLMALACRNVMIRRMEIEGTNKNTKYRGNVCMDRRWLPFGCRGTFWVRIKCFKHTYHALGPFVENEIKSAQTSESSLASRLNWQRPWGLLISIAYLAVTHQSWDAVHMWCFS